MNLARNIIRDCLTYLTFCTLWTQKKLKQGRWSRGVMSGFGRELCKKILIDIEIPFHLPLDRALWRSHPVHTPFHWAAARHTGQQSRRERAAGRTTGDICQLLNLFPDVYLHVQAFWWHWTEVHALSLRCTWTYQHYLPFIKLLIIFF